jgi:hypothetical protein
VRTVNEVDNQAVISYCDKFPLYSSKYLDYLVWKKVVEIMQRGDHLTKVGFLLAKALKGTMNAQRSEFHLDHCEAN